MTAKTMPMMVASTAQLTAKMPLRFEVPTTAAETMAFGMPRINESMMIPSSRCHHAASGRPKRSTGTGA